MIELSVVIPAYNESSRLERTLTAVVTHLQKKPYLWEIIVVDDGSADNTAAIGQRFSQSHPLRLLRHEFNRGKGYALRRGIAAAQGVLILTYDADGAVPIEEIDTLVAVLQNESLDIVIASRLHHPDPTAVRMAPSRRLIGRVYALLCRKLIPGIHDCSCGCKLFRREIARELFRQQCIDGYAHDVEIMYIALCAGFRIREVPVRWVAVPGSKIRLIRDSWVMLWSTAAIYLKAGMRSKI